MVHESESKRIAVIGIMYKIGQPDSFLSEVKKNENIIQTNKYYKILFTHVFETICPLTNIEKPKIKEKNLRDLSVCIALSTQKRTPLLSLSLSHTRCVSYFR